MSVLLIHPLHLHRIQKCCHGVALFKFHVFLVQLDHLVERAEVTHNSITATQFPIELFLVLALLNGVVMIEVGEALV